ncbi:MAG: aldehyde ferredoxin oxidoreductase family protein [Bacillota bacterium]
MGITAYINLTDKTYKLVETPAEDLHKFIGSRGYAAKILYDNVGPEVEPLSPENYLIFSPGPLTGTPWPSSARYTVTAKSPLTGIYGYANSSGHFGPEMRKAGYDALVFTGKAERPTALWIEDDRIEFLDGQEYWGMTTSEVEKALRDKYPGSKVACIGPAGENLVRIASVINDYGRAAARCGLGAVMGSKNLKAVAVKGSKRVEVPAEFKEVAQKTMKQVKDHPGSAFLREWGTALLMDPKNAVGDLPTRNHQQVQFEGNLGVNAKALKKYVLKNMACFACPIRCSRYSKVESGDFACETEGPEYETINALGPMVGNRDIESVIYGNLLCNEMGIDTISTGVVIAFAMECKEKGYLNNEKLSLEWGNAKEIMELIKMISYRQGLGDLLAEGVKRAAEKIGGGAEELAMHVKGMELPRQEPRVAKAYGLAHAVANRGADHLYALPTIDLAGHVEVAKKYFNDIFPEIMEVSIEKHKARMIKFTEAYNAISDCVGVCKFSTTENFCLYPEDFSEGLNALGQKYTPEELMKAGERVVNLERMYNVRLGLNRKADQLPNRFLKEAVTVYKMVSGDGFTLEPKEPIKKDLVINLQEMLDDYYRNRGWDNNGIPTEEKLRELGLEDLIKDLPS